MVASYYIEFKSFFEYVLYQDSIKKNIAMEDYGRNYGSEAYGDRKSEVFHRKSLNQNFLTKFVDTARQNTFLKIIVAIG